MPEHQGEVEAGLAPVLASGGVVGVNISFPPASIVWPVTHDLLASQAAAQALQEGTHGGPTT